MEVGEKINTPVKYRYCLLVLKYSSEVVLLRYYTSLGFISYLKRKIKTLNVHRAAETFSLGSSLNLRDRHGAISSGNAVERQPGLSVLKVLCDFIT